MTLPGLLVTGTDTDVGKTRVAAGIVRALRSRSRRVGVLKPVATGASRAGGGWSSGDVDALVEAAGGGIGVERVAPFLFEEPLAPSMAARRAGRPIESRDLTRVVRDAVGWWSERSEVLVVEGVGGLLCPVGEDATLADLAADLDFPLIIVARRSLGTLNHTLLTVEAAERRGLRVAGLVLNSPIAGPEGLSDALNAGELARRLPGIPVLAELPFCPANESDRRLDAVDWWGRTALPRLATVHR